MSTDLTARSSSPIRRGPRTTQLTRIPRQGGQLLMRAGKATASFLARAGASARAKAVWTRHLASEVGQGTVEYVGLLLLMATVLAAIVAAASSLGGNQKIGQKVVDQIGNSIDKAGQGK